MCLDQQTVFEQFICTLQPLFPENIGSLLEKSYEDRNISIEECFLFMLRKARVLEHLKSFEGEVVPPSQQKNPSDLLATCAPSRRQPSPRATVPSMPPVRRTYAEVVGARTYPLEGGKRPHPKRPRPN
jgi:hypothetical protein